MNLITVLFTKKTIPIILTNILQIFFNTVDIAVVGRFRGSIPAGAVGATSSLSNLFVSVFMGLSLGAGVSVARAVGAGNHELVKKLVHTAVSLSLISGAFLTVAGIIFAEDILVLMGTSEGVLPYATLYMQITFGGMIPNLLYNFLASILRAVGDTKRPLIFLTLGGAVNAVLNVMFVMLFGMDVDGVAIATVISQTISAVLLILALMKRTDSCHLDLRSLCIDKTATLQILKIGIPSGLQGSMYAISNVLNQSSVNLFGDFAISGDSVARNIESYTYTTMNSLYQTAMNFTGQNAGAKNYGRVKKVFGVCFITVAVLGLVMGNLVYIFGKPLMSLFIVDSAEAIHYGLVRMSVVFTLQLLCGIQEVSTGVLRGLGRSFSSMIISIVGVCGIRIAWIYTVFALPAFHTLEVLYMSYPISWAVTGSIQILYFFIVLKKEKNKLLLEERCAQPC